jgi:hypothetical protein
MWKIYSTKMLCNILGIVVSTLVELYRHNKQSDNTNCSFDKPRQKKNLKQGSVYMSHLRKKTAMQFTNTKICQNKFKCSHFPIFQFKYDIKEFLGFFKQKLKTLFSEDERFHVWMEKYNLFFLRVEKKMFTKHIFYTKVTE